MFAGNRYLQCQSSQRGTGRNGTWPTEDPFIIEFPSVGPCHVRSASAKMTLRGDDPLLIRNNVVLLKRCRRSPVCLSVGRGRMGLKTCSLLLVVVVLSPLWMMPLSVPAFSDVVVVMHHDSAVNTAVRTITENVPDIRVVEYGSLEYAMIIHRTAGRVVWVSHGSEDGILAGSRVLSWRAFSSRTQMTPGKDLVLACDSSEVNKYVPQNSVVGLTGPVDATLGGLVVAYLLAPRSIVLEMAHEHVVEIAEGAVTLEFLDLSLAEITYWTAMFLLSILAYYSSNPLAVSNPTWTQLVVHFLSENLITNSPSIVLTLVYLLLGQIDVWVAVWQIIAFVVCDAPAAFAQMILDPQIRNDCLFVTVTLLSLGSILLHHVWGTLTLDLVFLLGGMIFIAAGLLTDYYDDTDWVG